MTENLQIVTKLKLFEKNCFLMNLGGFQNVGYLGYSEKVNKNKNNTTPCSASINNLPIF